MKIIKFNAVWCPGCLVMKSRWKKVCNEIPDLDITNYDYDIDTDMVKKFFLLFCTKKTFTKGKSLSIFTIDFFQKI